MAVWACCEARRGRNAGLYGLAAKQGAGFYRARRKGFPRIVSGFIFAAGLYAGKRAGTEVLFMTEERILLLDNKIRNEIMRYMPSCEVLQGLVDFFSIFSDTTRIRIVSALAISEMCVNDISNVLGINQTTVSHQLKTLKSVGAVRGKRQGKIIFYSIANEVVNEVMLDGVKYLGY
jgi:ArsR family transcriptional regulator